MGRKSRVWLPDYYYHIVSRGNRKDTLFREPDDYSVFFYILKKTHEKVPFEIASYCLMSNHFHLQLRSREAPVSKVMSLINKRYATYFNAKYDLTGHVFEKRYYGEIINGDIGNLKVSRYIHWNPVEAGIVYKPENYQWSSYHLYYSTKKFPLYMTPEANLHLFPGNQHEKRKRYVSACHAPNFVAESLFNLRM